jgi:repressor LexA
MELTERQRMVLNAIRRFMAEKKYPPIYRDLCGPTGIKTPNGVRSHVLALQRKGYVTRDGRTQRTIRLVNGKGKSNG